MDNRRFGRLTQFGQLTVEYCQEFRSTTAAIRPFASRPQLLSIEQFTTGAERYFRRFLIYRGVM